DLERFLFQSGLGQNVLEPGAFPARVAHRADAPLDPGNVWLEQPAAIARALIDSHDLDRGKVALQLLESELKRRGGRIAADRDAPLVGRDLGDDGKVIAHEK